MFLLLLLIGKYFEFGIFFEIIWSIMVLGYSLYPRYLLNKIIKRLKYKNLKDSIYYSPINIETVSEITLYTGGKEGKFDVTFIFVDGRKESIRFYNPMINLIVPRIFGDKVIIKSKYE